MHVVFLDNQTVQTRKMLRLCTDGVLQSSTVVFLLFLQNCVNEVIRLVKSSCNLDMMSTNLSSSIYHNLTSTQRIDFKANSNEAAPL